jgi:hypothetical protein
MQILSWNDAIVLAKDLTRSSGRKVTISDEARYDKGLSGYGPRWVTLASTGEVIDASSSQFHEKYTNEVVKLNPVSKFTAPKGFQAYRECDYATALREFRLSAVDGDPVA